LNCNCKIVINNLRYNSNHRSKINTMESLCDKKAIEKAIQEELHDSTVNDPTCPREIDNLDIKALVKRLKSERAKFSKNPKCNDDGFAVIFSLDNDDTSLITRSIQEDQILKTRLKLKQRGRMITLSSFWELWFKNDGRLKKHILASKNPNEAKWEMQRRFSYKIATTFMPGYAKAIYEYFGAKCVLDPCAGWGDRFIGALASKCVEKYVGFDPNRNLRPGYVQLAKAFNQECVQLSTNALKFSNESEIRTEPFESGVLQLEDDLFDLVFTSPPFFDYEMYYDQNPMYSNWIDEFYKPLIIQSCRCVKPGGNVAIYVGDTSAGAIEYFMLHTVMKITSLKFVHMIAFTGIKSNKLRGIWVYEKIN